jgi:aminoglycoside phosphotransferase (APT) family kinase protein
MKDLARQRHCPETKQINGSSFPLRTTVLIDFERSGFGDILEDLSGPFVTDFGRDEMNWSAFLASSGALDGPQGVERALYYLAARTVEIATWALDRDPNFYRATKSPPETV